MTRVYVMFTWYFLVYSFADGADLVGCLTVTVEALEALKSLYDDAK